jgi:hypothetical protein
MKNVALILVALLLSGCLEDKKPEPSAAVACYDIINHQGPPPSPVLINKCTGDTWIVLYDEKPDVNGKSVDKVYNWYRMWTTERENAAP